MGYFLHSTFNPLLAGYLICIFLAVGGVVLTGLKLTMKTYPKILEKYPSRSLKDIMMRLLLVNKIGLVIFIFNYSDDPQLQKQASIITTLMCLSAALMLALLLLLSRFSVI